MIRIFEKGEAPMNENFTFLTLKMDSLAEKNDCKQCLFFSSGGTKLVSEPIIERGERHIKVAQLKECI